MTSAPVLACPHLSQEFILLCDASNTGIACVLSQVQDEQERIIASASRTLKAERKYFPTELECLAVLFGIEKFRPYIEGSHFTVVTDHASLKWLDNLKDPSGRLGRWALGIQQYDYTVVHRKGVDSVVPDALSRMFEDVVDLNLVTVVNTPTQDNWYNSLLDSVTLNPKKYPFFRVDYSQLFKFISISKTSIQAWVRVLPLELRADALRECHDSALGGHFGSDKTFDRIRQLYYWPKMQKDVREYVRKCEKCLAHKPMLLKPAGLMGTQRTASQPWEIVSADLIGPLPRSSDGFKYLLVVTDLF